MDKAKNLITNSGSIKPKIVNKTIPAAKVVYLEKSLVDFGTVKENELVRFKVKWLGKIRDFQFATGQCGCTDVWFNEDEKTIEGTLNIMATGMVKKVGENQIDKPVVVYINDGQPINKDNGKGKMVPNPLKQKRVFRLQAVAIKQ